MKINFIHSFKKYFELIQQLMYIYIALLIILNVFRIITLFFFTDTEVVFSLIGSLTEAFWMGFKFDTMVIFFGLVPILLLNTLGLFFVFSQKYTNCFYSILKKICKIYFPILITSFAIIALIDLYFYNFFTTHISVLIFGFKDDDTLAVLASIWNDYPVVWGVVGIITMSIASFYWVRRILRKEVLIPNYSIEGYAVMFVSVCVLFICGIRGSFFNPPLRMQDTTVSNYASINNLVPNGIFALKNAFKDKKQQNIDTDIAKTMKHWGFSSTSEAVSIYTGRKVSENVDSLQSALYSTTPHSQFLTDNAPNVVFIQMESMSEHFISLHQRETFNMLGTLEEALPHCIHFPNFLSATDGTIHTMEALLINSPIGPVSQSIYMNTTLETSAAKPFKDKGYQTSFVTGAKLGWRNIGQFIPHQYFDNVEGNSELKEHYSNCEENQWGAYDEFMFDRIFDILNTSQQPQFLFGMTITNHTPHTVPSHYSPKKVELPEGLKNRLSLDENYATNSLLTYQYVNDCLGKFIMKVKESKLGENTIIVATGDHSARRIFKYADADALQQYAVPLIVYIPEQYKPQVETYDVNAFGSHKDIFPTIYHIALSDAKYVVSGINMLDSKHAATNNAITGYKILMNSKGCINFGSTPIYYTWTSDEKQQLKPADEKSAASLAVDLLYGRSHVASLTYLVQQDLINSSKDK